MDKLIFTPGPLTTSRSVKEAMLRDLGSRDTEFIGVIADIRKKLLEIIGLKAGAYTTVLLPGSGTYGVEAVLSSVTPPNGKWLVIINGEYGRRIAAILRAHHIEHTALSYHENELPDLKEIEGTLQKDPAITHIAIVHCETSSGILNDITSVGELARDYGKVFFIDAMSSFGAIPIDVEKANIDFLVSSSNKCLESVPGCSFVIANSEKLEKTQGYARTLSLDLYAQWKNFESSGEFRFTPPIQVLLALHQALTELLSAGGSAARYKRYEENQRYLSEEMSRLGFTPYLPSHLQSCIITSFYYPTHFSFDFVRFYQALSQLGFLIYPGKLIKEDCFRIGSIGSISKKEVRLLLDAITRVLSGIEGAL